MRKQRWASSRVILEDIFQGLENIYEEDIYIIDGAMSLTNTSTQSLLAALPFQAQHSWHHRRSHDVLRTSRRPCSVGSACPPGALMYTYNSTTTTNVLHVEMEVKRFISQHLLLNNDASKYVGWSRSSRGSRHYFQRI
jgi:hypothetical protein